MNLNKILITGASGFLGKHIVSILSSKNKLYTLSRSNSHYSVDLSKDVPVLNEKFDIVIHAAGIAHLSNLKFREIFSNINVLGTRNLLRGLEYNSIPSKFVFISSVSVYGVTSGYNIDENFELLAKDPYGMSKIEAEKIVLDWCKLNNVVCTILRLPLVVGVDPPGNLSAMINGIKKGSYFNVSSGNARKSMVLASDVAKYVLQAAEVGGIFNLTDGNHPTIFDFSNHVSQQFKKKLPKSIPYWVAKILAIIGDLLGSRAPINSVKLKKVTSNLTFDDTKARDMFGWNPTPILMGFKIYESL